MIVYWTGPTKNTQRFVEKLNYTSTQLLTKDTELDSDCVLCVPTYGMDAEIPGPVRTFLNNRPNRQYIKGVVAMGNRNFGADFAAAGREIANKLNIPLIAMVELAGTDKDIEEVDKWYKQHIQEKVT